MEEGYRLKIDDKWIAIRRFYGEYIYMSYEDENNPNVKEKFTLSVANNLKSLFENTDIYNKIQIVNCGKLTPKENETSIYQILTKKIIK